MAKLTNRERVARSRYGGNLGKAIFRLVELVDQEMFEDFDTRSIERDYLAFLIESLGKLLGAKTEFLTTESAVGFQMLIPVNPQFFSIVKKEPASDFPSRAFVEWIEEGYLGMQLDEYTKNMSTNEFSVQILGATLTNPRWSWAARKSGNSNDKDIVYFFAWEHLLMGTKRGLEVELFPVEPVTNSKGRKHPGHTEALKFMEHVNEGSAIPKIAWKIAKNRSTKNHKLQGFNCLYVSDCRLFLKNNRIWCADILDDERINFSLPSG